jgi:hypothetical protein
MPGGLKREDVLALLGGPPAQVGRELDEFAASARALSSDHPRFIDEYPQQWVGVFQGQLRARGKTLKSVLAQLGEQGIRSEHALIRFIERDQRTLIL